MIKSQIVQLAAAVPPSNKGKILGQPKDLETANLIDIYNAAFYYTQPSERRWIDYSLPDKKGDPEKPVIPISIGPHIFQEAVCDFGASVNIMPKVIYDKILGDPLLYINMRLQLADKSLCYSKEILEDAIIRVGQSYISVDFVVLEIGEDERTLIILGRPFLSITKAIIYADTAKICFTIKDKKEKFSFKDRILYSPAHPQKAYLPEETITVTKKKKNIRRRKEKTSQSPKETIKIFNTIRSEYDHLLAPSFLAKKDDPGVPTIECTIGQKIFHKTFCYIGSSVNIMSKVTYEYLFGNEPLYLTYMQLQMADQSVRFPEGIAKDKMVKIQDHYAHADFMVLDMDEEDDSPIILGRPFLNTTNVVIYIRSGQIYFQFPREKVHCCFNSYTTYEQPKKTCSRRRRRRSSHRQEDQLPRNAWGDYEGEVEKDMCQP
jgi:hypothetical protein